MELDFLEKLSCLFGKQYLFRQDNNFYYDRYDGEQLTPEQSEEWILQMLRIEFEIGKIRNKEE